MPGESRSVVVRLSLDTAQAIRSSKEFGTEFGRALDQAERHTTSTRSAMDDLTSTSGKLALAAGAGLTAVIATTANFDEAMSHVAATGDDARGSLDLLREAAIKAGAETAFSASEAAGGIENLAKAGVSAKDILAGGLKGSLDLAAAGGLEVADAAEVAATALTQFKLQGADVPHVADLLAAAAGKAQGDVSDMSFALKQSGLVASQMGLSIEETTGTLAAFASAGLLGSDAGTSFRTMLLRLANPTTQSADLMQQLGIQAYDAQGKFVGMASLAGQLKTALSDQTQAQRDAALATIFGSDAIRAASVLYSQGSDGISDWTAKVDDSGYAAETAATRMDNLKGDLEQLRGSLETAFIGSGEGSQGMLRGLVQGATDLVNAFNKAPGPVQQTTTALLAVTAIGAGGFWFTSKAVRTISDTKKALDDLGWSSQRTSSALKGLSLLGGAVTVLIGIEQAAAELVRQTDKAAPSVEGLTREILGLQDAGGLQGVFGDLGDLRSSIELLADPGLAQKIGDVYDKVPLIGSAFADIAPGLRGARQDARDAQTAITALDDALAGIVQTGSPQQAKDAFDELASAYHLTADEQKQLRSLLPGYQEALDGVANSTKLTGGATEDLGVKQRQAAQRVANLKNALADEKDAAKTTAKSFLDFGNSLDDSKVSLQDWIRQMAKQAQALREFTTNARTAAKRGLDEGLIQSLQDAGAQGALRMKQLANATSDEIGRANKAWRSGQDAIRDYVNFKVPTKRITVDASQAKRDLHLVYAQLAELNGKHVTSYIDVIHRSFASKQAGIPIPGNAGGGSVPKDGGPYADRYLYMLAPGEEVISNRHGQADRFRADRAAGRIPGYADGGTTGGYGRYATVGAGGTPAFNLVGPVDESTRALKNLADAGKKELEARKKLLEHEIDRDKKELDLAKQHRDAVLQDIQSLKDSIANRFKSDLFGQQDANYQIQNMPQTFDSVEQAQQWYAAQQTVNDALNSAHDPVSILKEDIAREREAKRLYRQLRQAGLHGAALAYAQQNASNEQLAALLNDPQMLQEYQHLYGVREKGANQLGHMAAFERYGDELKGTRKAVEAALDTLHEHTHELRQAVHRLDEIEKNTKDGPKKTGDAVGDKINGAGATAGRHR